MPRPTDIPRAENGSARTLAAVDLGSNSFHLLVARPAGEGLEIIDRLKQRVALAEGLDEAGWLHEDAQRRAIECLEHFGQRLRTLHPDDVRVVGTNTFRAASNAQAFLSRAQVALGHPIEIVSGREEARLVYLGVSHHVADAGARKLVIDVGGGSTELILGEGPNVLLSDSLYMGHLAWTVRFFPDGRVTKKRLAKAELAARMELETVELAYKSRGWSGCIGSSGTALAIAAILRENDWSASEISRSGLNLLHDALLCAGTLDSLQLAGLKEERRGVIAGGVAIFKALFDALELDSMLVSDWALREGLLYDLLGRLDADDVRASTIQHLCERYAVDTEQAARVEETAIELHEQVAESWNLTDAESLRVLAWAARVHEVGLALAYSGHHKHGAYLLGNSDLPGFSRQGTSRLAALVLAHRGKIRRSAFESLPGDESETLLRLTLLLRLAVVLHRSRSPAALPPIDARAKRSSLRLAFPSEWLDAHPLTRADLEREAQAWRPSGYRLEIDPPSPRG